MRRRHVRPFSWILAGVVLAIAASVLHNRASFGAVYLLLIAGSVTAIVLFVAGGAFVDRRASAKARRREKLGLCIRCGYDLRHTAERCPECGMPIWRDRDPSTGQPVR